MSMQLERREEYNRGMTAERDRQDAEIARLRKALEPFAKGAAEIPDNWPDGRGLLIGESHPDNPKRYNLLLAFVRDFRRAREALKPE